MLNKFRAVKKVAWALKLLWVALFSKHNSNEDTMYFGHAINLLKEAKLQWAPPKFF
jgi:hypothetical protein